MMVLCLHKECFNISKPSAHQVLRLQRQTSSSTETETRGVGILNMNSPYLETGGNWTQHAIWIEPVTDCVDHNVTYDFTVPDATPDVTTPQLSAQAITDRGRFANFNLNNYQPNQSNARNSSLQAHAYQAANYALKTGVVSFNISSSLVGKSYPITQTYN